MVVIECCYITYSYVNKELRLKSHLTIKFGGMVVILLALAHEVKHEVRRFNDRA